MEILYIWKIIERNIFIGGWYFCSYDRDKILVFV